MAKPRIDVIMSVYNGKRFLRQAIESVLNQSYPNFKFIIVDDGSKDNSVDIINSFHDERIELIRNEKTLGLTKSLNKALRIADGKYVARQDADDVSLPDRFESQVNFLEKHPEVDVLGTSIYLIDDKGTNIGKRTPYPTPSKQIFLDRNEVFHGSAMIRRDALQGVGGYGELFRYSQDYDLWLRIATQNNIRNLKTPLYSFRMHNSSVSLKKTKEQHLYSLFAIKTAKNKVVRNKKIHDEIKSCGITCIMSSMSLKEKLGVYFVSFKRGISSRLIQSKAGRALLRFYHVM